MNTRTVFPEGSLISFAMYELDGGASGGHVESVVIQGFDYYVTPLRPAVDAGTRSSRISRYVATTGLPFFEWPFSRVRVTCCTSLAGRLRRRARSVAARPC